MEGILDWVLSVGKKQKFLEDSLKQLEKVYILSKE